MSGSYVHANAFLMRFPRPVLASVMRVTRFFSGALVAVLLVMTLLEVRSQDARDIIFCNNDSRVGK